MKLRGFVVAHTCPLPIRVITRVNNEFLASMSNNRQDNLCGAVSQTVPCAELCSIEARPPLLRSTLGRNSHAPFTFHRACQRRLPSLVPGQAGWAAGTRGLRGWTALESR